jgi:hypothetical protein
MTNAAGLMKVRIPRRLDDITSEWLGDALQTEIAGVDVREVIGGTATKIILAITYRAPSSLPDTMCLKAGMGEHAPMLAPVGIYETEARFFRDEAHHSKVRAPTVYWADVDDQSYGAILMEDLSRPAVRFGSAPVPLSLDKVASALENLALLHAGRWNSPWLESAEWLDHLADPDSKARAYFSTQDAGIVGDYLRKPLRSAVVPAQLRDPQRSLDVFWAFVDVSNQGPQTLLHGDPHIGNTYIDDGVVGLCDWQTARRGSAAFDVAYLLGSSLAPETRRAAERQLLHDYLSALSREGVPSPPTFNEMWHRYRTHMAYGYFAWLTNREEFQPEEITAITLERLACAVVDLDTAAALGV